MAERPLHSTGRYNLDFVDWVNEWEGLAAPDRSLLKSLRKMKMQRSSKSCSICLAGFSARERIYRLDCAHIFHCACLEEWLCRSECCPNCRRGIAGG